MALCIEKSLSRSSGVRGRTFSSAERPPPLVRAEEVLAPLEGSIRTTRGSACRLSARGREVRVGPVPLQTTSAVRRVLAPGSCVDQHTEKCATFVNDCKAVCILEEMMKTPQPTVPFLKKWIRVLPDHSDDGMER